MYWTATKGGCLDPHRRISEKGLKELRCFLPAADFCEEGSVMPRILGCVHLGHPTTMLGEVTARVHRSV